MTPLEIRRTQGNYCNNEAGAFVEREIAKQKEQELIKEMDPNPESIEIEMIKDRINRVEVHIWDLRQQVTLAIEGLRDTSYLQGKLDEYAGETFDLEMKLKQLRGQK